MFAACQRRTAGLESKRVPVAVVATPPYEQSSARCESLSAGNLCFANRLRDRFRRPSVRARLGDSAFCLSGGALVGAGAYEHQRRSDFHRDWWPWIGGAFDEPAEQVSLQRRCLPLFVLWQDAKQRQGPLPLSASWIAPVD